MEDVDVVWDVGQCEYHVGVGGFPNAVKFGECSFVYVLVIAQRSGRSVEQIFGLADVNHRSGPKWVHHRYLWRSVPCR